MRCFFLILCIAVANCLDVNAGWYDEYNDESDESCYSYMLDDVYCYADDLSNDDYDDYDDYDDWWYDDTNIYEEEDGIYSNSMDVNYDKSIINNTDKSSPNNNGLYEYNKKDKLVCDWEKLKKVKYTQATKSSCVYAAMNFLSIMITNVDRDEGDYMLAMIRALNPSDASVTMGEFHNLSGEVISDAIQDVLNDFGMETKNITNVEEAIDNGYYVMTVIDVDNDDSDNEESYHQVVVFGYDDDSYYYYDPSDGMYHEIDKSDIHLYYIGVTK